MNYTYQQGSLMVKLDEDLDMNICKTLRTIIDGYIIRYQPKEFIMDLGDVKFMDSSGIGLIMGRYNLLKIMDSNMTIVNPTSNIKRVLELSNIANNINMRSE